MTIPPETIRELERLRARVEELEFEMERLNSTVDTEVTALMDYFDLTATEARMVRAMGHAGGAPLSRPVLVEAMQSELDDLRTVDSHVKRIRKKCGHRLPIDSIYGIGYRLLPGTAKEVREIMAGKTAPPRHRVHLLHDAPHAMRLGKRPLVPQSSVMNAG